MKKIKIAYTPTAAAFLRHLHPIAKKPLKEIIEELALKPFLGKPLRDEFEGYRSHRLRKYRVIYRYHEEESRVEIVMAGPRTDIYTRFSEILKKMKKTN